MCVCVCVFMLVSLCVCKYCEMHVFLSHVQMFFCQYRETMIVFACVVAVGVCVCIGIEYV